MEGCEVVDHCPDCAENDELVVVEGQCKLVCPVCGGWMLGREEKGKDEI